MGTYETIEQATNIPLLPNYLNYDPVKEPQTRNGQILENRFWTINPLTDDVIGEGKSQHHPTNFNRLWEPLRAGLEASTLDLTDARVIFKGFDNNASFRAEIILPKHDFKRQLGEATSLKIRIADSHDQSFRRQVAAMIMRLACLNGMSSISENTSMTQKHTINATPEILGAVASAWPKLLENEAALMAYLREVPVSDAAANDFYIDTLASRKERGKLKINNAREKQIWAIHDMYRGLGCNAYRVFNVLTHMQTHVQTQKKDSCPVRKQLRLEAEIEGVIRGNAFHNLAHINDMPLAA